MVRLGTPPVQREGSEFRVDEVTALAFLNTDVAASFAAIAWLAIGWWFEKKPTFVGLLTGAVAGLATITPAAGYVSPVSAVIIGVAAGVVCYFAVAAEEQAEVGRCARRVWGVHGVGGALGIVLLGVFGTVAFNPAGADGLIAGGTGFFLKQLAAIGISSVWAFVFTYAMLWLINLVTPVKVDQTAEESGLDAALHGETAYLGEA